MKFIAFCLFCGAVIWVTHKPETVNLCKYEKVNGKYEFTKCKPVNSNPK